MPLMPCATTAKAVTAIPGCAGGSGIVFARIVHCLDSDLTNTCRRTDVGNSTDLNGLYRPYTDLTTLYPYLPTG